MIGWPEVALAALNVIQVCALAWIAAWLQRSRLQVRQLNGEVELLRGELGDTRAQLAASRPSDGL